VAEASDLQPLEWLARLGPKLLERQQLIEYWRRYYDGDQDLPAGPNQHADAYRRFQRLARTNLCFLCAESRVHRTQVIGFRDVDGQDDVVWRLWQSAKLDARQIGIWRKAYSRSAAYVIVGVDPRNPTRPRVTIEGPENVIVETDAADRSKRLAALRMWHDPILKRWLATIYLPGVRHHWISRQESKDAVAVRLKFSPDAWEVRAEPGRSLPDVPVVPFLNGDEGEEPRAAFAPGIDVQNRLNLTLLNRLTAERYAAFRQRWITNYEPEIDDATGLAIAPFKPGVDQTWTLPPPEAGQPESKFGDFQQTDTSQMLRGVEADMRAFAAVTLTPVYYLPGDLVNIGADSIAALDAGHIAAVKQNMAAWGEGLEEVLQLMAGVADLDRDLSQSEVVWARPENFQPAVVADFASKLKAAGVPLTMLAEEIGWTPQRVVQLRAELASDAFLAAARAPQAAPQQPAARPVPRESAPAIQPGPRAPETP
jgi:Phage portal protein, SPP1 Gp6-like